MDDELLEQEEQDMDYEVEVAPQDDMSMILVIFTTIFLIIGVAIVAWELNSMYDLGKENKKPKTARTK